MSEKTAVTTSKDRFGRIIERQDGRDFPYYDGRPVEIATWKWLVILLGCVVGFLALTTLPEPDNITALGGRIAFPVIMLAVFIALTGRYWTAIFRRLSLGDVGLMFLYAVLNIVVTAALALLIRVLGASTDANPATDGLGDAGGADLAAFYIGTGVQLLGEEIFSILPFLAVMYWLHHKAGLGRKATVVIASLLSAVWFGAAHLPTYDWNFVQAMLVIGTGRLVLNLAFIRTKNILVSTGAHIINDWSEFTFTTVASSALVAALLA